MWIKGRENKDGESPDAEIRSLADIRGKWSYIYKRYFNLPRSRKETDERHELLQTQLDNERRERRQATVQRDVRKKSWTKISTNEAKTFGL